MLKVISNINYQGEQYVLWAKKMILEPDAFFNNSRLEWFVSVHIISSFLF